MASWKKLLSTSDDSDYKNSNVTISDLGGGSGTTFLRRDGNFATPTNTTYSTATSSTLGLVKIGYSESGQNYPVELSSGKMYVNVPWTNTQLSDSQVRSKISGTGVISYNSSTGVISSSADNYGSWALAAGNTNSVASGKSVTISGSGATSVSQSVSSGNHTVTISSTDTNTTYSLSAYDNNPASGITVTPSSGSAYNIEFLEGDLYYDTSGNEITASIASNVIGASELKVSGNGSSSQFLRSDGDGTMTWATPTDTNTTYSAGSGLSLSGTTFSASIRATDVDASNSGSTGQYLQKSPTTQGWSWASITDNNTTYSITGSAGYGHGSITLSPSSGSSQSVTLDDSGEIWWSSGGSNLIVPNLGNFVKTTNLINATARMYTRYNYYYYPNVTYGINYYNWNSTLSSTSPATSWAATYNPCYYVPFDCTIKEVYIVGEISSTQTIEFRLLHGTPTYNSNSSTSLSDSGLIVNTSVTTGHRTRQGTSNLNLSLSAGDILIPAMRKSTNPSSTSYAYFDGLLIVNAIKTD